MVEALIISESDEMCVVHKKLLHSYFLAYQLTKYMFDADGNLSLDDANARWGADLCTFTDCVEEEEVVAEQDQVTTTTD